MNQFPDSICIIDDDADFVAYLERYLQARTCTVQAFGSAEEFLQSPDALASRFFLIDLTLPGADGVDLIALVRAHSNAGIVVISGRMGPDAFSNALATGADMFINKPVRFDQVYQAILSVARRVGDSRPRHSDWLFNARTATLTSPSGQQAGLTPTEAKLITRLLEEGDGAVARGTLADAAGIVQSKDDRNLDAAMFRLRRHIEQQTSEAAPLKTVHGVGYCVTSMQFDLRED
jgi:DNA-binding response OmpR family regulator